MTFSLSRAGTIARREYLFTVTRKAFLLTLILTPAFYAFLMFIMIKPQVDEAVKTLKGLKAIAVVDSSGLLANAPREIVSTISPESANPFRRRGGPKVAAPVQTAKTRVEFFPDQAAALAALESDSVKQVVVVPPDYLETGRLRRYVVSENIFNDESSARPVTRWIARALLTGRADSLIADRALSAARTIEVWRKAPAGGWEPKNDAADLMDFFLPFIGGLLLGMTIIIGGQYLLQGLSEEKESRILESMLCAVTAEELMVGKLIGLGGAGLTLVVGWIAMAAAVSGPGLLAAPISVSPLYVVMLVVYFLLGYFFYGTLMTGIGAITSNLREANQFAFVFTFSNFIPFYLMPTLMGNPNSPLAVFLSLFPPTAPVSMMLRLGGRGGAVPPWQIVASVLILLLTGLIALRLAARLFRIGLLMYGKTPTLPEIVRWMRAK